MEIALLNKSALRLKGKSASFVVNPQDAISANAALFLDDSYPEVASEDSVMLQGAGDYEIGGVKITGFRGSKGIFYSMSIDGIDVVVGTIENLAAMQHKVKEHNLVVVRCDEPASASFLTSLATNVVLFYGAKAEEVATSFEKDNLKQTNKYTIAAGKLPTEVETVLLT